MEYQSTRAGYESQSSNYQSPYRTEGRKWRIIGCTCGGRGPCRATCRVPVPE